MMPRHGTNRRYVMGCREDCCRRAHTLYQNLWRMGRTNKTIDSTGTRRRIQALLDAHPAAPLALMPAERGRRSRR